MSNDRMWRNGDKEMKKSKWEEFKKAYLEALHMPTLKKTLICAGITPIAAVILYLMYGREGK